MSEGFDVEPPNDDDFAGMLAALEGRVDRRTIALAVGVNEAELDLIAIGRAPTAEAGERLRMLYRLAARTEGDLRDPQILLQAAGIGSPETGRQVPLQLVPRLKTFIVVFLVVDAIVFGVVILVVALRM